eukprot:9968827-Alexandrium_andersonii.AAC.1
MAPQTRPPCTRALQELGRPHPLARTQRGIGIDDHDHAVTAMGHAPLKLPKSKLSKHRGAHAAEVSSR